jgi:hypothetical protein
LIPLLAPSNNKPLPCAQLLSQVRQAPTAPPPGVKQQSKPPLSLEGAPVNKSTKGAASSPAVDDKKKPAVRSPASARPNTREADGVHLACGLAQLELRRRPVDDLFVADQRAARAHADEAIAE